MRWLACLLFAAALGILILSAATSLSEYFEPRRDGVAFVVPFPERPQNVVEAEDAKDRQKRAVEIVDGFYDESARQHRGIRFSVGQTEPIARQFDELVTAILEDDRGRFVAGSAKRLAQFLDLFSWRPPTVAEIRRLEEDADLLVADVRRAYENPYDTRVPPTELTSQLEAMLAQAESWHRVLGESLARLRYLVEQARIDGHRGEFTLREAIERAPQQLAERALIRSPRP